MSTTLLFCVLMLFATCYATWTTPAFCRGKKCPPYTVMSQTADYEIRKYKPSIWLEVVRATGSAGRRAMFEKLYQYLKGKNAGAQRMEMAVPVVGHLSLSDSLTGSMRFYLGEDISTFDPPRPTDNALHLHHDPEMSFYVKSFRDNAWRNINTWKQHARTLISKIPMTGTVTEFCGASYGPKNSENMYNEVWIHTSSDHGDHHHHHHAHNDEHDHHHGDHDHAHDDTHGHDHGGDHTHEH